MATWGDFIAEMQIVRVKPNLMYVPVDQAITVWEERNQLRAEAARLKQELAEERHACAQDVEDFAQACAEESDHAEIAVAVLRAAAQMLRERGQTVETEAGDVPVAEPYEGGEGLPAEPAQLPPNE